MRREPLMMLTPNLSMPHAGQVLQGGEMRSRGSHLFYEALEARGVKYAIRIPADDGLERDIGELLPRPVGRQSSTSFKPFANRPEPVNSRAYRSI